MLILLPVQLVNDFPGGSAIKNLPALQDTRFLPLGQEDPPEEGMDNPLYYSCLENPMDRGAWPAAVHRVAQSRTRLKQPSSSSNLSVGLKIFKRRSWRVCRGQIERAVLVATSIRCQNGAVYILPFISCHVGHAPAKPFINSFPSAVWLCPIPLLSPGCA